MTPNVVVVVENKLDNAPENQMQSNKTVECLLRTTYSKLAVTEANLELFTKLIKLNLATNDVKSFVSKQTSHMRCSNKLDVKVQRVAMQSKIHDASSYAKVLRRERDALKRKISNKYGGCKSKCRRLLESFFHEYKETKRLKLIEVDAKIEMLKSKNLSVKEVRVAPDGTRDFLSDVNVFLENQHSMSVQESEGPFICDSSIPLSQNELKLLSRGPKFMIREEIDSESFEIELEKMVAKEKFNDNFSEGKDDCSMNVLGEERGNGSATRTTNQTGQASKMLSDKESKDWDLLWEENSTQMVYNLKDNTLDLGNLRATSYPHNKEIFMPPPKTQTKKLFMS